MTRSGLLLAVLAAPMALAASCHLAAGLDEYERSGAVGVGGAGGQGAGSSVGGSGGRGGAGGQGGQGGGNGGSALAQWASQFGNIGEDFQSDVAVLDNDSSVLVGVFNGNMQLGMEIPGGLTANATNSGFLAVHDPSGVAQLAALLDGTVASPRIATNGTGVAVAGSFVDALSLDNGTMTPTDLTVNGGVGDAAFVAAFNSAAEAVWAKRIGEGTTPVKPHAVAVGNGRVVAAGVFTGTVQFDGVAIYANTQSEDDAFIAAYEDSSGNVLWADHGDDVNTLDRLQQVVALGVDGSGDVYVGGNYEGGISLKGGNNVIDPIDLGRQRDAFLARYSTDGVLERLVDLGGAGFDAITAMAVNDSGEVIVAGVYAGALSLPGGASVPAQTGNHLWIAKIRNSLQASDWAIASDEVSDGTIISDIAFLRDPAGSIALIGSFDGPLTIGTHTLPNAGQSDLFWVMLDSASGVLRIAAAAGDGDNQVGRAIAATDAGAIMTGTFQGTLDFGNGTNPLSTSGSDFDIFLTRLLVQ